MIYLNNNTEIQEVWIPRQEQEANRVSTCDRCYAEGYADGVATCGHYEEKTVVVTADTMTILPDEGYAGMSEVEVDATSWGKDKYDEGYSEGESDGYSSGTTDGEATQKAKLASTAFTRNGLYTREDGWNEVEVNVADLPCVIESKSYGLESGFTGTTVYPDEGYDGIGSLTITDEGYGQKKFEDGQESVRSGMTDAIITANGYYPNSSGWSAVTVSVPQSGGGCTLQNKSLELEYEDEGSWMVYPDSGYDGLATVAVLDAGYGRKKYDEGVSSGYTSGYTDGENHILSGMTTTAITQNGSYSNPSGWSGVTVNVPTSANLESRSVVMTADTQTFTPSSGYDGMSAITVDASNYGQEKHDEGYDEGKETVLVSGWNSMIPYMTNSRVNEPCVTNPYAENNDVGELTFVDDMDFSDYRALIFNDYIQYIGHNPAVFKETSSTRVRVTSIEIPYGTVEISHIAQEAHLLEHVTLPITLSTIGEYSFLDCRKLDNVYIPDACTYDIGEGAFKWCYCLKNLHIGNKVQTIGEDAFAVTGMESLVIPDSVTSIGKSAFIGCNSLTSVTIGGSVQTIGVNAFDWSDCQNCGCLDSGHLISQIIVKAYHPATLEEPEDGEARTYFTNAAPTGSIIYTGVNYWWQTALDEYTAEWLPYLPSGWTIVNASNAS